MRRATRAAVVVAAATFMLMSTLVASAAPPSTNRTPTDMVNGKVRALAQAGDDIWIGGAFTEVLDGSQNPIRTVGDLVAFNGSGQLDSSIPSPIVTATSGVATVYGLSVGPDGDLYLAGTFSAVNDQPRDGVAAIDPSTGALLPFAPKAGSAKSILATSSGIFVGTAKLLSYQSDGTRTPGYTPAVAHVNASLRGHVTLPAFRGLAIWGNTLVAACQCDSMDDANGTGHPVKAVVEIDATTGDLLSWSPGGLSPTNDAWGITPIIHDAPGTSTPTIYLAAGGNDFTAAYDLATGTRLWLEDCSGSCQGITWFQNDLIVGGHFDWISKTPTGSAGTCNDNEHPKTAGCYLAPHLVAFDPANGDPIMDGNVPWNPGICCDYEGVWVVLADANGTTLHVGGAFARVGTATWTYDAATHSYAMKGGVKQDNYARFDAPLPPQQLDAHVGGTGSGSLTSTPAGLACPTTCSASFPGNSTITLTAKADAGSTFAGWSGDCSGSGGKCVLVMSAARSATATFTPAVPRKLIVTKSGNGKGTVTSVPAGVSCGAICSATFPGATVVTLSAKADTGSSFAGWSGDCTGTGTCKVTMSAPHSVGAAFDLGSVCGRILFVSGRQGNGDIFSMNPDGSDVTDLTNNPARDADPTWSANCRKIAFTSTRGGSRWHVFVMNADGTGVRRVTSGPGNDTQPSWAPGGLKLVFVSDRSGNRQLYTVGVGGAGRTRLTQNSWADIQPDWSPQGDRIVFASNRFGSMNLYTIWPNGSHRAQLTSGARPSSQPEFSPTGARIVFISSASGAAQVWTMDANGTGKKQITKDGKTDAHPSWSPIATRIAYASPRSGNLEIWVIGANGTGAVNVTHNPAKDTSPSWR